MPGTQIFSKGSVNLDNSGAAPMSLDNFTTDSHYARSSYLLLWARLAGKLILGTMQMYLTGLCGVDQDKSGPSSWNVC